MLFVPVMAVLLAVSFLVIERHYEGVTAQMTAQFSRPVGYLRARVDAAADPAEAAAIAADLGAAFGLEATLLPALPRQPGAEPPAFFDLSGRLVQRQLLRSFDGVAAVAIFDEFHAGLWLESAHGILALRLPMSQVAARNPHQLFIWTVLVAGVMTLIAFLFLKNQVRPIRRLAAAAEAFGRGQRVDYVPAGATEVRAAGQAFLEMRERIERHIEQRTLMLSGVSHDLRTPLTRIRLGLAMLEPEAEARALQDDAEQMEELIDRFLDFARADVTGPAEPETETDLTALVAERIERATRGRQRLRLQMAFDGALPVYLRPRLFARALDNLIANALRYGRHAEVRVGFLGNEIVVAVEDDGPGIAPERRDEARLPFVRLDAARGASRGSGAGLGLAIAADAMRLHGGRLELDDGRSPGLGGLEARLVLPRSAFAPVPGKPGMPQGGGE